MNHKVRKSIYNIGLNWKLAQTHFHFPFKMFFSLVWNEDGASHTSPLSDILAMKFQMFPSTPVINILLQTNKTANIFIDHLAFTLSNLVTGF